MRDFDPYRQCAILHGKDQNISAWLSALPLVKNHFDLAAQELRDALALRYKKSLSQMPKSCDGCCAEFSIEHALDCRFGGLVSRRHNEIRDAIGDLASLVWGNVVREPVVCDKSTSSDGALVADLCVRGVWIPQSEALFDIRVVDTDAQSYRNRTPLAVLCSAECDKKRKYLQACLDRRATFTPLCVSVDGMMGHEAAMFLKRIADLLSAKWETDYGLVMGWIRTRLSFVILRATLLCNRGCRTKWRSLGLIDGASIAL